MAPKPFKTPGRILGSAPQTNQTSHEDSPSDPSPKTEAIASTASMMREARLAALSRLFASTPESTTMPSLPQNPIPMTSTKRLKNTQIGVNLKTIKDIKSSSMSKHANSKPTNQDQDPDPDFSPKPSSFLPTKLNKPAPTIRSNLRSALENRNLSGVGHTLAPLAAVPADEELDTGMLTDDFLSEGSSFGEFSSDEDEEVYRYSTKKAKAGGKRGKRDVKKAVRVVVEGNGKDKEADIAGPRKLFRGDDEMDQDFEYDITEPRNSKAKRSTIQSQRTVDVRGRIRATGLALGAPDEFLAASDSNGVGDNNQDSGTPEVNKSTARKIATASQPRLNHKRKSMAIYSDFEVADGGSDGGNGDLGKGLQKNVKRRNL